jgi:hypothetical protein
MEPRIVYVFDHSGGYQELMEKQLRDKGVAYLPDRIPTFTWGNRIIRTLQIAELHPDELLCFVDAWDTLFLGEKWELTNPRWEQGVTFASQKRCWPDPVGYEYNLHWEGKVATRWRYLNSNPMIGMGRNIARALDWGWRRFPLEGHTNDTCDPDGNVCERFYTRLLFSAPKEWDLKIDTECVLCHTTTDSSPGEVAVRDGRVFNLVTHTYPIFLHLNGKMTFDVGLIGA